jgi:oligopeptide/dipeptide ABC transporter ATP-binding protein
MSSPILTVNGLVVELGGHTPVRGLSLRVPEGACVGLVGETGAGKSLTCRAITGLLGRVGGRIAAGHILFRDIDLARLSDSEWQRLRGRRIALLPQSALSALNPVRRVGSQVEETVAVLDPDSDPPRQALALLEQVHMPQPTAEVLRLYPHELSGGMRQRVMIALALAGKPELLVADEPTTALDVTVQREILSLLREIQTDTGMSSVLVTHDLRVVQSVAQFIVVMYGGRVMESGPTEDVISRPRHPYTLSLLEARLDSSRHPTQAPASSSRYGYAHDGCPFSPRCRFATGQCASDIPQLTEIDRAHLVACWHSSELDEQAVIPT